MKKQFRMEGSSFRWRMFSHKNFATFNSMHRAFSIGVLSVAMLASVDLKAQSVSTGQSLSVSSDSVEAELVDATTLDDVQVTATHVPLTAAQTPRVVTVMNRADVAAAPAQSVQDLLESLIGVDVRQRGEMGVQTDISIRGGTFDQITILLNGINITSPHTGHHSADFPILLDDIERIEVIEGPAARTFGTSAFTGAINIVTKNPEQNSVSAHLFGGMYGLIGGEARASLRTKKVGQQLSGGYKRTDGATENSDFNRLNFFYQGEYDSDALNVDWQTSVSSKQFGANTFYSAAYPNQWEEITRWIASVRAETKGTVHLAPAVYWNRKKDHFQLVRDTSFGENFHREDVYGANLAAWVQTKIGKTAVGTEIRSENILSSNLGRPMEEALPVRNRPEANYTNKDFRNVITYYAEHAFLLRKWTISLGVLAYKNSHTTDRMRVYPGIDLAFRPSSHWKLTASWNNAMRLPTFTDLYYKSPTIEGNVGLKAEETSAWDLGAKFRHRGVSADFCAFYHRGKNMIDWVMYTPDDIFHSTGFQLDNIGAELSACFLPREIWGDGFALRKLSVNYSYIHQERHDNQTIFKSNYALEYLRHKFTASAECRLVSALSLALSLRYQEREGFYIKYDENHQNTGEQVAYTPYLICDARLAWEAKRWMVYAEASNLFNRSYHDYGNIPQPGIWVKGGVKVMIGHSTY